MPEPGEFKILRDEIAKLISINKKQAAENNELRSIIEQESVTITQLVAKNTELEKRLSYYENPHAPPSHKNIPSK